MSTFICNKGIYMIPLSKLMEYITQRVNSNYEILLIMYQYWLISCNQCTTQIQVVTDSGNFVCKPRYIGMLLPFLPNFSVNPKLLQNKVYSLKKSQII